MSTPQAVRPGIAHHSARDADSDLLKLDDRLKEEMLRLAAINQDLLGNLRSNSKDACDLLDESEELVLLRAENAELRARVEELEQALRKDASPEGPWSERQKEYEALLEEKSEVIRSLHQKIQELQDAGPSQSTAPAASHGDVARLQKELEEQRRQLEEDEAVVMQQLREMEMAMSKDRAELARQRNEIQRLHNDLNHEIEIAARDPSLRGRLLALERLQAEVTGRKNNSPPPQSNQAAEAPAAKNPATTSSGLFRRIFGK